MSEAQAQQVEEQPTSEISTEGSAPVEGTNGGFIDSVDESYKDLVKAKKWGNINDALRSYENMESFVGKMSNAIVVPDDDNPESWDKVYSKLGRPENLDGYSFDVKEDEIDVDSLNKYKELAHKVGLNPKQAKEFQEGWDTFMTEQHEAMQAEQQKQVNENIDKVKKEWGSAYNEKMDAAKAEARKHGLPENIISALEHEVGYDKMMNMMADNGARLMEDGYVAGNKTGGGMTQGQLKESLAEIESDPDLLDPYKNPSRHKMLVEKRRELYKLRDGV